MSMRALLYEARAQHVGEPARKRRGATMMRKKASQLANSCDDLRFRVKELKHLVTRTDSSMAAQLVKNIAKSSTELCKSASHLRDVMKQAG